MYALETTGLSFRYGEDLVLDKVNLQVPTGSIYGFLGPNGAGKTTTLKLALGLLRKQQGEIAFFGKAFGRHRLEVLRRVGTLVEAPSLYSHLTAFENLRILQRVYDCPVSRIPVVLEVVGLAGTGPKKAGQFSLGMKQRLAIAMALLHSPELLILDEPTNGLDPSGIIEMRELMKKLSAEGITVLVSSHLLAEIEKLVTHVGIIHKGQMRFQGTFNTLKERQHRSTCLVLGTSDPETTVRLLKEYNIDASRDNGQVLIPVISQERMTEITRLLVQQNIGVFEITTHRNDLESIFLEVVNQ